jgi:hypothetical protein
MHPSPEFSEAYHMCPHLTQIVFGGVMSGEHGEEKKPLSAVAWEHKKPHHITRGVFEANICQSVPQGTAVAF